MSVKKVKEKDWIKEGVKLFGKDRKDWKFKCSGCGMVQSSNGLDENYVGLDGYFYATVFCRCVGWIDDKEGCKTALDEGQGKPGIILIKKNGDEVPIFDFARDKDIN